MLIYGWRKRVLHLATATYLCGQCHNPTAHALRRAVTKFTLFFIPLFPISSKYFTVCTFCGATNQLSKAEAQQVLAVQQSPAHQPQAPAPQPRTPQYLQPGYPAPGGLPQQQPPFPQQPPHPGR
ncbi:MAG TPA: zinc-ribbon domain-containing protein [Amycolatopsis sp.]|uniref:zinc-ribbon domain-containing protein n=1 Tax=Amycolatopsis sp. TaxID=37632 RepID=UPI002B49EE67|nr:zinc-ribbon domain-containing protein [Amycolatopsis sp.]HKS44128.1 zinc-ribbon domain-containing protein [Amycolatopsis sp.]